MTTYTDISFDTSEIDKLNEMLKAARDRPHAVRAEALDRAEASTIAGAREIAAGYTKGEGILGDSLQSEGSPVHRRVFSDLRESLFLETGSPNTGAPRAWLTGPARKSVDALFIELSESAEIW